ncbi:Aste57867_17917 [Aphanomyces stellatus]|uniref:Aste57867_17917 protein n=1 Tax=Aphanomyces stellatus TaxID=120398 RepID=A0A485L8Z9_9STRA|nr:hypothetical protein As57867_017856 [Aphanomyces stellatus]VFT94659.1 Aste57867_17917 [Aphanomyces stellatus]
MRFLGASALLLAASSVSAQSDATILACNTTVQTLRDAVRLNSASCKITSPDLYCSTPACDAITTAGKAAIAQGCGKIKDFQEDVKFIFPNLCSDATCKKTVQDLMTQYGACQTDPVKDVAKDMFKSCTPCRFINDTALSVSLAAKCGFEAAAYDKILANTTTQEALTICKDAVKKVAPGTSADSGNNSTIPVIIGITCAVLIILGAVIYKLKLKNDIAKRNFDYIQNDTQGGGDMTDGGYKYTGPNVDRIANDIRFDEELAQFRIPQNEIQNVSLLVKGGYGVVFHASFGKDDVAMKQLLPSKSKDFDAIQEFMNEIRLCARLEHPKIVKFIGISWSTLHDLAVLSEFMTRGDVSTLLKKEAKKNESSRMLHWINATGAAPTTKATIAADVADALVYLHSFQPTIIHRDLKSKNVLLSETWEAKLSDFGISRVTSLEETMTSNIGTVAWIAPEVLSGGRYSEKADIYSFGVLLSELDTCETPYTNLMNKSKDASYSNARIALMVSEGSLKPDFTDRIPEELLAIALECLAFNENDRPTAMALSYKIHTIAKNLDREAQANRN